MTSVRDRIVATPTDLRNIAEDMAQADREIIESAAAELEGARDAFRSLIAAVEEAGLRVYYDIMSNTYSVRLRSEED